MDRSGKALAFTRNVCLPLSMNLARKMLAASSTLPRAFFLRLCFLLDAHRGALLCVERRKKKGSGSKNRPRLHSAAIIVVRLFFLLEIDSELLSKKMLIVIRF